MDVQLNSKTANFIDQTGVGPLVILSCLLSLLNALVLYSFVNQQLEFSTEIVLSIIISLALYFFKLIMNFAFLSVATLLFGSKEMLQNLSSSAMFKIILLADFVNIFGDLSAIVVYINSEIELTNLREVYASFPLVISNFANDSLLIAGILKDFNLFQLASTIILTAILSSYLNLSKTKAFSFSLGTIGSGLVITNLIWAILILSINHEYLSP